MKSRYYFLFHTLSRLSIKVLLKYKNKMIFIKYSRPIGMFPATQFWVATHRLITTALEREEHLLTVAILALLAGVVTAEKSSTLTTSEAFRSVGVQYLWLGKGYGQVLM
jgi:hypothetical protein